MTARAVSAHCSPTELQERLRCEEEVTQCVDGLRSGGALVFHGVQGDGCFLDHVIISRRGVFVVETRVLPKPWPKAKIYVQGHNLLAGGRHLLSDPRPRAADAARWMESFLSRRTGRRFPARAIVAFPGWYVQQTEPCGSVWVVEPRALAALLDHQAATVATADVALAAWHLSRYLHADLARAAA